MVPIGVANLVAAIAVFVYQNLLAPDAAANPGDTREAAIGSVVFCAIAFPVSAVVGLRILAPAVDWHSNGQAPGDDERRAILGAPGRLAVMAFVFWVLASVTFGTLDAIEGEPLPGLLRGVSATVVGGLVSAALSFLLVERDLRPIVAAALIGSARPPDSRALGIGARILLSWALGSGIPLVGIALAQLRPGGAPPLPPAGLFFLAISGLGVGALMLVFTARAVIVPIDEVRRALARVQEGDLDEHITVNDGGEVGQLQAGFNRMVEGLRERQVLEDLFGRHVGPEVARRAVAQGSALGGEQRTASALFVDLIGSTAMAEQQEPEAVVAVLNAFFAAVVQIVGDEGGWVNKFEGDGALCVFGTPSEQPDHAVRALRAARRLQAGLAGLPPAAIGVSSGTVVAGNVGSAERLEYTVIGDPVNEASRLSEAAKDEPGRVLASSAAMAAAGDESEHWHLVAELSLRGRSTVTSAYAPVAYAPVS